MPNFETLSIYPFIVSELVYAYISLPPVVKVLLFGTDKLVKITRYPNQLARKSLILPFSSDGNDIQNVKRMRRTGTFIGVYR